MLKKIVKLVLIASFGLMITSCHKGMKDDIRDLENRVTALEQWQTKVNENIDALQRLTEALDNQDYLLGVAPLQKGGVDVGYILTFKNSGRVSFYNETTPEIGIREDVDQNSYWTYKGEWLLDAAGNKVLATGAQGITPELKIENNRWMVSTDYGKTWSDMGPATAGSNGSGSLIQSIEKSQDGTSATITLSDGQVMEFLMAPTPFVDRTLTEADIPDAAFRTYLIHSYDTNHDGAIQISEVNQVDEFPSYPEPDWQSFASLKGIEYFESLTQLVFYGSDVSPWNLTDGLDLSKNTNLKVLQLNWVNLPSIKVPAGIAEIRLYGGSSLVSLDLTQVTHLTYLNIYENLELEEILMPQRHYLQNVEFVDLPKLKSLDLKAGTRVQHVNLSNLEELQEVNVSGLLNLVGISFYSLPKLQTIDLSYNFMMDYGTLSDMPALRTVYIPLEKEAEYKERIRAFDYEGTELMPVDFYVTK